MEHETDEPDDITTSSMMAQLFRDLDLHGPGDNPRLVDQVDDERGKRYFWLYRPSVHHLSSSFTAVADPKYGGSDQPMSMSLFAASLHAGLVGMTLMAMMSQRFDFPTAWAVPLIAFSLLSILVHLSRAWSSVSGRGENGPPDHHYPIAVANLSGVTHGAATYSWHEVVSAAASSEGGRNSVWITTARPDPVRFIVTDDYELAATIADAFNRMAGVSPQRYPAVSPHAPKQVEDWGFGTDS